MTTTTNFPAACVTNTFVLHDFTEIAYIVCTGAIPANVNNANSALNNSPEHILSRLKNAEKQFRQNSILVALDTEKLELFTFYKKVDVVKDQKTILGKFGLVCRLNSCIVAYKNTARLLELLKPETARVYRLFTSAVLSSVQLIPYKSGRAIGIGTKVYLIPDLASTVEPANSNSTVLQSWLLHRVYLQVVPGGQLILTIRKANCPELTHLSDIENNEETRLDDVDDGATLYLAPVGQLARYKRGWHGSATAFDSMIDFLKTPCPDFNKTRQLWISETTSWLDARLPAGKRIKPESTWIEAEMPCFVMNDDGENETHKKMEWRRILWPVDLTWMFQHDVFDSTGGSRDGMHAFQFVQDWYAGAAQQSDTIYETEGDNAQENDTNVTRMFDDEVHFENQFQLPPYGPPTFPSSQTVYPTPPDAALAHATPGISMFEGHAPTPMTILPAISESAQAFPDQDMLDAEEITQIRAGSGFYEDGDDLFEEVPNDTLGGTGAGEEPNWDFFDSPSFEEEHSSRPQVVTVDMEQDQDGEITMIEMKQHDLDGQESKAPDSATLGDDQSLGTKPYSEQNDDIPFSLQYDDQKNNQATDLEDLAKLEDSKSPLVHDAQKSFVGTTVKLDPSHTIEQRINDGRRPSVFSAVDQSSRDHDDRYSTNGKYWFNPTGVSDDSRYRKTDPPRPLNAPLSPGSDMSTTSSETSTDDEQADVLKKPVQTWTEYDATPPVPKPTKQEHFDQVSVGEEISQALNLLGVATGEEPFMYPVRQNGTVHRKTSANGQEESMVAQILVKQVSQSRILNKANSQVLHISPEPLPVKLTFDDGGSNAAISNCTLSELTAMLPGNPAAQSSKVYSLENPRIRTGRADGSLSSNPSILRFWNILGLEPISGPKGLVAFCLHPSGDDMNDGCSDLIARLGDVYAGCNLGEHRPGKIPGFCADGLLSWNQNQASENSLEHVCRQLGSMIDRPLTGQGTIIIYMVSPMDNPLSYMQLCSAFIWLKEAYLEEGQSKSYEIVLQIVPASFVVSPETLVVPTQEMYIELALEVYNRVPQIGITEQARPAQCSPAVLVSRPIPNSLAFELKSTPISPFSKHGPCLHLGYSYSADKRWVTMVWSDDVGEISLNMSYCLRTTSSETVRKRLDVFRDVIEISNAIMSRQRGIWRLVVAKNGYYEIEEINEWLFLAGQATENPKTMDRLILLSIEMQSSIHITPMEISAKVALPSLATGTPGSTPQMSTTSPEQLLAATPTPSGQIHPGAPTPPEYGLESLGEEQISLVDPLEDSWIATFPFGLNQSHHILEVRPALASGLLLKRVSNTTDDLNEVAALGVNLIAMSRASTGVLGQGEKDSLMHDLIRQYRGLVTIAATRGCIDYRTQCVPWHIATAVRGSQVLFETM